VLTVATSTASRADVVEERTIEESVPVPGGAPFRVVVANVFGSIHVTAHARSSVDMTATERIRADTQADLERARAEATLRIERGSEEVEFRVRNQDDDCNCRWVRWDDYVVEYDIELRVPEHVELELSTVNEGEIVVERVHGDFTFRNVNGAIRLRGLRGSGSVTTVNGELEAMFERAPEAATAFKTVNGRIEVAFPADLSADLAFKTMHGEIWTDFDVEPLAVPATSEGTREGTRYVFRSDRRSMVRVGHGGPTHSFETLNGDIEVVGAQR
jgi:hypothetical protein